MVTEEAGLKRRSKILLFTAALLVATSVGAQIDTPMVPIEQDLGDLFRRASASRMVVIGTVVKSEGVSRRLSQAESLERFKPREGEKTAIVSLNGLVGGSLFEIRINDLVCEQSDFALGAKEGSESGGRLGQTVPLFVPRDEPLWENGNQKEFLFEGHTYLLFLVVPDSRKQREWVGSFQLDPTRMYFRGEERSRGLVPLILPSAENPNPEQPPVLDKVRQLCEAVRPSTIEEKLAALDKLVSSDDPVLQREAKLAMNALRAVLPHR
jgi:hypothetical protein